MTTETRERASRDLAQLETPLRVPETVPEFLEVTRPAHRRRDWLVIGAVLAAVVAGIVLLIVQPWADTGWTGDWKDLITEEGASAEYTGDWKDLVTSDGAADYSGDWKDLVADDGSAASYTGDWKDTLAG